MHSARALSTGGSSIPIAILKAAAKSGVISDMPSEQAISEATKTEELLFMAFILTAALGKDEYSFRKVASAGGLIPGPPKLHLDQLKHYSYSFRSSFYRRLVLLLLLYLFFCHMQAAKATGHVYYERIFAFSEGFVPVVATFFGEARKLPTAHAAGF